LIEWKHQKNQVDHRNWESELARKWAMEEEERKEGALNHREVAEQSKHITDCSEKLAVTFSQDLK
jgi:hypothetical protein